MKKKNSTIAISIIMILVATSLTISMPSNAVDINMPEPKRFEPGMRAAVPNLNLENSKCSSRRAKILFMVRCLLWSFVFRCLHP